MGLRTSNHTMQAESSQHRGKDSKVKVFKSLTDQEYNTILYYSSLPRRTNITANVAVLMVRPIIKL